MASPLEIIACQRSNWQSISIFSPGAPNSAVAIKHAMRSSVALSVVQGPKMCCKSHSLLAFDNTNNCCDFIAMDTLMGDIYADTIYVVVASKGDHCEFWAAATSANRAAAEVQRSLQNGWTTKFTGWRLCSRKCSELKMRVDSVRKLNSLPR